MEIITREDGTVTVTDPRKTVTFERDARTDVDPMEAAKLYIEYLKLLDTCPGAHRYAGERTESLSEESYTPPRSKLSLKPKKITLTILEGEIVS